MTLSFSDLSFELSILKSGASFMADNINFPDASEYMQLVMDRLVTTIGSRFSSETLFVEKAKSTGSPRGLSGSCRNSPH